MPLPKLLGQTVIWQRFYCLKSGIHNGWTAAFCQTSRPNPKSPQNGLQPKAHVESETSGQAEPCAHPDEQCPSLSCLKTVTTLSKGELAWSARVKLSVIHCNINPSFKLQSLQNPASTPSCLLPLALSIKKAAYLREPQFFSISRCTNIAVSQFVCHKWRTDGFYQKQTHAHTHTHAHTPKKNRKSTAGGQECQSLS